MKGHPLLQAFETHFEGKLRLREFEAYLGNKPVEPRAFHNLLLKMVHCALNEQAEELDIDQAMTNLPLRDLVTLVSVAIIRMYHPCRNIAWFWARVADYATNQVLVRVLLLEDRVTDHKGYVKKLIKESSEKDKTIQHLRNLITRHAIDKHTPVAMST